MTDLRIAHEEWLNHFEASSLNVALIGKRQQLRQALEQADPAKAWATIQSMRDICAQLHEPRQVAETLLEAGRAAFELGDFQRAKTLLADSAAQYDGHRHMRAVAKWMLGYVLWNLPGQHENATIAWQDSLTDFKWLYAQPFPPEGELYRDRVQWYRVRVEEMQQALDESIELDALPPRPGLAAAPPAPGPDAGDQPPAPAPAPDAGPAEARPVEGTPTPAPEPEAGIPAPAPVRPPGRAPRIQLGYLGGFTVLGDPAALDPAFQAVGVEPHSDEEMIIEQVTIQDQAFGVYNPYRGGEALRLTNKDLAVVRVYGDSMNNAGIEDGDYVLVRHQDNARNGDIVVAEIDDEDSRATIKRFRRVNDDLVLLISESTQDYPPRDFTRMNEGFTIRGKVLAIFKKQ